MHKILVILFLIPLFSFAQKETPLLPRNAQGKIIYTAVVNVDSVDRNELYSRGREWFAKAYKSSKNVMQMEDKESGRLIGKALMQVYMKSMGMSQPSGYINYTVSIYAKDGKYKYEVTDFYHTGQPGTGVKDYGPCEEMINTTHKQMGMSYQKIYNGYLFTMDETIKALVSDLEASMKTKSKNEDW